MSSILHQPLHIQHLYDAGVTTECVDLVTSLLQRDASMRMSVDEALQHPWFAMHASGCGCNEQHANNIVAFDGLPTAHQQHERQSALGVWAMMQGALRGHPVV